MLHNLEIERHTVIKVIETKSLKTPAKFITQSEHSNQVYVKIKIISKSLVHNKGKYRTQVVYSH